MAEQVVPESCTIEHRNELAMDPVQLRLAIRPAGKTGDRPPPRRPRLSS